MTDHQTQDEEERATEWDDPDDVPQELAAEIVIYGDKPAECTIHPPDARGVELLTAWITAEEGSFVSVEDIR